MTGHRHRVTHRRGTANLWGRLEVWPADMPRDIPAYHELQVRLTPRGPNQYDVLVAATSGATAYGGFSLPFSRDALENFRYAVDPGTRAVRGSRSPHYQKAKQFGTQLFDALVADEGVRQVYASARHDARLSGRGLRVTLYLTRAPELADVPWEFLYHRPDFLAQSVWTPVVRCLELQESPPPLAMSGPLRILGMISPPVDDELAELDVQLEKANLEHALASLIAAKRVDVRWLSRATLPALQREVAHGEDFHVFHYIGHGRYDEQSGEGFLLLERPDGRALEVSGERIGALLCDRGSLRLAVLNACEAAKTAPHDPLAGVAASLIERNVPAVVGMQFAVTDTAAITFAQEFYATLSEGYPVDAAMTEGRRAMAAEDEIEWGTPVLFMRGAEGRLFDLGQSRANRGLDDLEPGTTELAPATDSADGEAQPGKDTEERSAALEQPPGLPRQGHPPPEPPDGLEPRRAHDGATERRVQPSASRRRVRRWSIAILAGAVVVAGLVITLTGSDHRVRLTAFTIKGEPIGIAFNRSGAWILSLKEGLTHITGNRKRKVQRTFGENTPGVAIVKGVIWIAGFDRGKIFRYDPRYPRARLKPTPLSGVRSFAVGDKEVWAPTWNGNRHVVVAVNKLTSRRESSAHIAPIHDPQDSKTADIAWGPPGIVWLANEDKTLFRIDPGKRARLHRLALKASGLAVGSDGSVWITTDDGHLKRINPRTLRPETNQTYRVGESPVAVAVAPDRRVRVVWVARADGGVSVLDVSHGASGGKEGRVDIGPKDSPVSINPTWISVDKAGNAWVGTKREDKVWRITLPRPP